MSLKIGDSISSFSLLDEQEVEREFKAPFEKKIVFFFYPKDNTPGCTVESCNLRDNYSDLIAKGFDVVGVSADTEKKHRGFIEKYKLPFRLIADTDKTVLNAYKCWGEKKFMGKTYDGILRTTFVIGSDGMVEKVFEKVKTKHHTQQILDE